jgi:MarR family transcriptional regulator, organic hydroperoxide resistance regulator
VAAVEPAGITHQQYNVLRILRGAAPEGLPTLAIGERLIEETPGMTRLLDRLEAKGLVRRERCREDRRQVLCWITEQGVALLGGLEAAVDEAVDRSMAGLAPEQVEDLLHLMEKLRRAHCGPGELEVTLESEQSPVV